MDLLWNPSDFDMKARPSVVQLIMSRLNQRIAAQVSFLLAGDSAI